MPRINSGETLDVRGNLVLTAGTLTLKDGQVARSSLAENSLAVFPIDLNRLRVHDAPQTLLPTSASSDDLGLVAGTFGTDGQTVQTSDAKATTVTQRARFQVQLPDNYIDGQDIQIRVRAGMITTVSDTTATVDVEAYALDGDGSVGGDLCTTAATTINTTVDTKNNRDFVITPTGLTAGDILDVRITIAITDSATGTAVIGEISKLALLCDVR